MTLSRTCVQSLLFLFVFLSISPQSEAQALRYQDEAGNLHFVDNLSDVPPRYREQVIKPTPAPSLTEREYRQLMKIQARAAQEERKAELRRQGLLPKGKEKHTRGGSSLSAPKNLIPGGNYFNGTATAVPPSKKLSQIEKVEVFVSPSCKQCQDLELFLRQNRIRYKKLDIVTSQKAFELFDKLGAGTKLPITKIGAKIYKGLDFQGILDAATGATNAAKPEKPLGTL